MSLDSVERFTTRVQAYARYRPSYPPAILTELRRECGLSAASVVADIGCGTGLLSQLFVQFGCEVFGVEPNASMRSVCERVLLGESRFHLIDGRAEDTTLPAGSADFVTAAQAFHWFDQAAARTEFHRIFRPGGKVALLWNERTATPGFMEEHEALVRDCATEQAHPTADELRRFFGADPRIVTLPNPQLMDWEGLRGRLESSSNAPLPETPEYAPMIDQLARIFKKHAHNGRIIMEYETRMYYGNFA